MPAPVINILDIVVKIIYSTRSWALSTSIFIINFCDELGYMHQVLLQTKVWWLSWENATELQAQN